LGTELCRLLGDRAIPVTRSELDLRSLETISDFIRSMRPGAVINAAAYTKVDRAESEPEVCRAVNALAVREVAKACGRLDCPLVQVSTDYVYGSAATRRVPYSEDDPPGPVNAYGHTKLAGEEFAAGHPRHYIVRTCGLYVAPTAERPHQNFVASMLRLASDCMTIKIVNDQFCTPSYVPHVARAIQFLLSTESYGTYHITQRGAATWFEFASELVAALSLPVTIQAVLSGEYPTPARRPAYSVLDCAKYEALGGPRMPHWREALNGCLRGARGRCTAGGD
jgi:dTDP-4-dehydrorhamnose reductase